MKKVTSMILALVMVFSLAGQVFAAGDDVEDVNEFGTEAAVEATDGMMDEETGDEENAENVEVVPMASRPYAKAGSVKFLPAVGYEDDETYKAVAKSYGNAKNNSCTLTAFDYIYSVHTPEELAKVDVSIQAVPDGHGGQVNLRFSGSFMDTRDALRQAMEKPGYKWNEQFGFLTRIQDKEQLANMQVFDDVAPGYWYTPAVNALTSGGLLKGRGDGTFDPDATMTYAEFCTVVDRLFDQDTKKRADIYRYEKANNGLGGYWYESDSYMGNDEVKNVRFAYDDVATAAGWAYGPMVFVYQDLDISDNMHPAYHAMPIRRGQAIAVIAAALSEKHCMGKNCLINNKTKNDIPDWNKIEAQHKLDGSIKSQYYDCGVVVQSNAYPGFNTHLCEWNPKDILIAYQMGIINGIDDAGTCYAEGTLTRAQLCQILYNAGLTEAGMLHANKVDMRTYSVW